MPDTSEATESRTETLTIRCTPGEKRKVNHVSEVEGVPYAELLREMGLTDILGKYDRMASSFSADSDAA